MIPQQFCIARNPHYGHQICYLLPSLNSTCCARLLVCRAAHLQVFLLAYQYRRRLPVSLPRGGRWLKLPRLLTQCGDDQGCAALLMQDDVDAQCVSSDDQGCAPVSIHDVDAQCSSSDGQGCPAVLMQDDIDVQCGSNGDRSCFCFFSHRISSICLDRFNDCSWTTIQCTWFQNQC